MENSSGSGVAACLGNDFSHVSPTHLQLAWFGFWKDIDLLALFFPNYCNFFHKYNIVGKESKLS